MRQEKPKVIIDLKEYNFLLKFNKDIKKKGTCGYILDHYDYSSTIEFITTDKLIEELNLENKILLDRNKTLMSSIKETEIEKISLEFKLTKIKNIWKLLFFSALFGFNAHYLFKYISDLIAR